jgi:hypothetical protein
MQAACVVCGPYENPGMQLLETGEYTPCFACNRSEFIAQALPAKNPVRYEVVMFIHDEPQVINRGLTQGEAKRRLEGLRNNKQPEGVRFIMQRAK